MRKETIFRIFSKIPELETERLKMRKMLAMDATDMFDYARRPEVTKYLTWSPHPDVYYTREYLEYLDGRYRTGLFYDWGLIHKGTGRMIGTCGFTSFDMSANSAEVGYVLHPDFWGQGLAPEALRRVMQFGFEKMDLHRIEAHYMEGNERSRRVMEKLGMTFEGYRRDAMLIKGSYRTIGVCAILKDEFDRFGGGYDV